MRFSEIINEMTSAGGIAVVPGGTGKMIRRKKKTEDTHMESLFSTTCEQCSGRGHLPGSGMDRVCPVCDGAGTVTNERELTDTEEQNKEKYVKGMKKNAKDFTKRYGKAAKSVMYATATKMAKNK